MFSTNGGPTARPRRGRRSIRTDPFLVRATQWWDAATPDETIALRYFEPLGTRNATGVTVDEITVAIGDALVARQVDSLVGQGLLRRQAAEGMVRLTSAGTLLAARLETLSAYETFASLDGVARARWTGLTTTEQEVFRFFAMPVDGGGAVAARVSDIAEETRTVVVDLVLDDLARKRLIVRHRATATVELTRAGQVMVAYRDAAHRRGLAPIARGRLRRTRRRQNVRAMRRLAPYVMAFAALYPLLFDVPLRLPSHEERIAPPSASHPTSVVDLSTEPPRRAALPNDSPPGDCRRGAEVIRTGTLWAHGEYLGEFLHYASFRCGVAWWVFTNDDARYYYGALHVRLHADEDVDEIEVVNDAKTLVGRVTSTISTCVGYDVYLVLPDGSKSEELRLDCDAASPGAGVPVT